VRFPRLCVHRPHHSTSVVLMWTWPPFQVVFVIISDIGIEKMEAQLVSIKDSLSKDVMLVRQLGRIRAYCWHAVLCLLWARALWVCSHCCVSVWPLLSPASNQRIGGNLKARMVAQWGDTRIALHLAAVVSARVHPSPSILCLHTVLPTPGGRRGLCPHNPLNIVRPQVPFLPITPESMESIVKLHVEQLGQQVVQDGSRWQQVRRLEGCCVKLPSCPWCPQLAHAHMRPLPFRVQVVFDPAIHKLLSSPPFVDYRKVQLPASASGAPAEVRGVTYPPNVIAFPTHRDHGSPKPRPHPRPLPSSTSSPRTVHVTSRGLPKAL
jgi:hypothetical protein